LEIAAADVAQRDDGVVAKLGERRRIRVEQCEWA
jgi:hypothetical protein